MRYQVIGRVPPQRGGLFHGEARRVMEAIEPYVTERLPPGEGWVFRLLDDTNPVAPSDGENEAAP